VHLVGFIIRNCCICKLYMWILFKQLNIQRIHKRMMRFQNLARNVFLSFHTVIFGMSNFLLALATDLRGLHRNASRTLSMMSSDKRGGPGLLPLHKHPFPTNCRYRLVMLFLHDACFLNRARNPRCTVITDLDTSKRSTQKAFSCCNAILETGPAAPQ